MYQAYNNLKKNQITFGLVKSCISLAIVVATLSDLPENYIKHIHYQNYVFP